MPSYQMPPDPAWQQTYSTDYGAYKGYHLGTAAGTYQVSLYPAFLSHIQVNARSAGGSIAIYDLGTAGLVGAGITGTAGSLVGFINLGTQTNTDPGPPYQYKVATKTGLSICWTANIDMTVAALP